MQRSKAMAAASRVSRPSPSLSTRLNLVICKLLVSNVKSTMTRMHCRCTIDYNRNNGIE